MFLTVCLSFCATLLAQSDLSSPKAALKSLFTATERGDAAGVQKVLLVENDPNSEALKAYGDLILAAKKLGDTAKQKYPVVPNGFAQATILPEDAARIDSAQLIQNGDSATIKILGRAEPVTLRRIDGSWRVIIQQGADDPARQTRRIDLLKGLTDAMNKTTEEIAGDKFPTVQDAETRVKERVGAAMSRAMQNDPPASRPATQEAK